MRGRLRRRHPRTSSCAVASQRSAGGLTCAGARSSSPTGVPSSAARQDLQASASGCQAPSSSLGASYWSTMCSKICSSSGVGSEAQPCARGRGGGQGVAGHQGCRRVERRCGTARPCLACGCRQLGELGQGSPLAGRGCLPLSRAPIPVPVPVAGRVVHLAPMVCLRSTSLTSLGVSKCGGGAAGGTLAPRLLLLVHIG